MNLPIASLSMYDWPETAEALDALWQFMAQEFSLSGITAPNSLERDGETMSLWTSDKLLVGQTCGWPYANYLRGKVIPFARFDYGLKECPPGYYRSVYIGQNEDDTSFISGQTALYECPCVAINGEDSQSGFHVFSEISGRPAAQSIPDVARHISGAHRNSVKAIANGDARIAAIDAVAFELAKRFDPVLTAKVSIIGYSEPKPGLPLITSPNYFDRIDVLFSAVENSLHKLPTRHRDTLRIYGLLNASDADYDVFLNSQNA